MINVRSSLVIIFLLASAAIATSAHAGGLWLTKSGTLSLKADRSSLRAPLAAPAPGVSRTIDVAISLNGSPTGDNVRGTVDDRTPYEEIVEYFADAIFEESEGRNRIGNVYFYSGGKFADKADVVWTAAGWPCANVSGVGIPGQHIYMFDDFNGYNLLNDRKGAGYTLAHEFGHYFYGLYDEYKASNTSSDGWPSFPHSSDSPVIPSVMNSQWNARNGDMRWLNFSIIFDPAGGNFRNTKSTAQHRMYGASGWETLKRPAADDPKPPMTTTRPARNYYSEFADIDATSAPGTNLPDAGARAALTITWMSDKVAYEIVLDRSGSMYGSPLDTAKSAAKYLVDVAEVGSAIGIVQYDTTPSVLVPVTDITGDAVKAQIKAAIDTIDAGNLTALNDAALLALSGLTSRPATNETRVVFLLTDGYENASLANQQQVIDAYNNAKIPLFTIGYGYSVDTVYLAKFANDTGGKYYQTPQTLAEITQIFNDARKETSHSAGIGSATVSMSASTQQGSFTVDSTVKNLIVSAAYTGSPSDVVIELTDPAGGTVPVTSCTQTGSDTICSATVNDAAAGNWTITFTSSLPLEITYSVDGQLKDEIAYTLSATSLTGDTVNYPEPIKMVVVASRDLPITDAVITGTVLYPDGVTRKSLTFRDDGVAPDDLAGDGLYSAIMTDYNADGSYKVAVNAALLKGQAKLTYHGAQISVMPDGTSGRPADVPLDEDVSRSYNFQIMVQGVQGDDYGNSTLDPFVVVVDNSDVHGKIDYAGDVDFFTMTLPDPSASEVVFRVTNISPEMAPVLTLYNRFGEILQQASAQPGREVSITWNPAGESDFYASVQHSDANGTGTYDFSAGSALAGYVSLGGFAVAGSGDGNGTVSCDTPVTSGGTSVCTITPAPGYILATLADNGTDKLTSVSGNRYTIANVSEYHAVVGTFIPSTIRITTSPLRKAVSYKGVRGSLAISATNATITQVKAAVSVAAPWISVDLSRVELRRYANRTVYLSIPYWIAANPVPEARSGSISIGAATYAIAQEAVPCVVKSLATTPAGSISSSGGPITVTVDVEPDTCQWRMSATTLPASHLPWFSDQGDFPLAEEILTGDRTFSGAVAPFSQRRDWFVKVTTISNSATRTLAIHQK